MRKALLLLIGLCGGILSAQSLGVYKADTLVVGDASATSDLVAKIQVKNISNSAVDVKVKRLDRNYNNLTDSNAVCWDICFQPDVSLSLTSITIQPGEVTSEGLFSGHVYPDKDGTSRKGPITYVFFDENNPSDSMAFTINYAVSDTMSGQQAFTQSFPTVGLVESNLKSELKVYPNPASDELNVAYSLAQGKNQFEIVSLLGKTVYKKNLEENSGKITLNLSRLDGGIYFYLLRHNGETMLTRKLIVE